MTKTDREKTDIQGSWGDWIFYENHDNSEMIENIATGMIYEMNKLDDTLRTPHGVFKGTVTTGGGTHYGPKNSAGRRYIEAFQQIKARCLAQRNGPDRETLFRIATQETTEAIDITHKHE